MVTQEELRKLFSYNPETGELTRLSTGKVVSSVGKTGYRRVNVGGKIYREHRIIWRLVYGEEPDQIDHINGDRADNRIANLRNVSGVENRKNQKRHPRNTSGHAGVSWNRKSGKWMAQIADQGKYVHLGVFDLIEDAVAARKAAEVKYGYHENHGTARKRYPRD